jgi:transforming growth factor-beta-induced protein
LKLLTKAGLAEYLSNTDGITVFAPTDAAFKTLLADLGATSLNDIPTADLTNILLYHVIGSKAMSTDLKSGYFPTLSKSAGNSISMYISVEGGVSINKNTKVTTADVAAKNGVIHVVDKVILPPSVVNIALDNDNFSILVQAVVKAGLVDALSGSGPFTVFAPTNAAFTALFAQLGISGIDNLTAEQLTPILTYHVVSGNVLSTALSNGQVPTLSGKNLNVNLSSGVKINDSEVVAANIQGSNGVVHVINKVLLP